MMYWGNHMGTGDWIFSILGTLIIIGLIVALIVWAVSPRGDRQASAGQHCRGAPGPRRRVRRGGRVARAVLGERPGCRAARQPAHAK